MQNLLESPIVFSPSNVIVSSLAAIAVACRDIDVRNVKAIIVGPHETPYEYGFFEVSLFAECDEDAHAHELHLVFGSV